MTRAVAVFSDDGIGWFSRFLKRGFRHCYCLVDDGRCWILVDARAGLPEIRAVAPSETDIATWCRAKGVTVVETEVRRHPSRSPFAVTNCVGMVKATLAVRSPAVTPYQLYLHLWRAS